MAIRDPLSTPAIFLGADLSLNEKFFPKTKQKQERERKAARERGRRGHPTGKNKWGTIRDDSKCG